MEIFDKIISDRGSRYAVSGGPARDRKDIQALLSELKRNKRFAKATHNSWAAIISGEPVKDDDGESGAGALMLQMLERAGLENHLVVVTRWYGGKHLGGDRFRHVADAVRHYLRETGTDSDGAARSGTSGG
ncbi:YigZ family protein [Paracoccus onubensis]|uniref:YigZ family protein n=1 Tax=Paracoccus onubensis TaxID=1675788 RepID=A0A418SQD9_9RHOB|nr:YigZ family protein [Paracoccus onubensis]RJE83173.1 YigZ family protein [Paracoccus onubensis]